MKKVLIFGILLLGCSAVLNAETDDDLGDEFDMEPNPMEIIQDFMNDCNNEGDYYGCFSVAMKYEKGEVVKKDISKAIEYYEKSCKHGSKVGCEKAKELK